MEIKFRYIYGIPDKPGTYFFRYFTIEEIEQGKAYIPLPNCKIISRDQFTGLKDKNGKEIYENDIVKGKDLEGYILDHIVKYRFGGFEPFCHHIKDCLVDNDNCEIIGNIYGVK